MNINENFRNESYNLRKINGYTYKITNISAAVRSNVPNLVPKQCLDIILYLKVSYEK